jgi:hypothetical protein
MKLINRFFKPKPLIIVRTPDDSKVQKIADELRLQIKDYHILVVNGNIDITILNGEYNETYNTP